MIKNFFRKWFKPKPVLVAGSIAIASFYGGGELTGFWVEADPIGSALSKQFLGCTGDSSDSTTYTFTAHAIGTAHATRRVLVGAVGEDGAGDVTVASATVAGNAATEIVDMNTAAGVQVAGAIYLREESSGTTADITVTFSEAITSATICVWAAYNLASSTAVDVAESNTTGGNAHTLSLDVSALGIAVGICGDETPTSTFSWVGLVEDADAADAEFSWAAGSYTEDASASTPLTASCDSSGSADGVGVSASFL